MRKAITYLQCATRLKQADRVVKSNDILEIAGILSEKVIEKVIDTCSANSFEKVEACVQVLKLILRLCFKEK